MRRLSKCGNKYCFTIPRSIVEQGLLKPGKLYMLKIEELEGEGSEKTEDI